MNQTDTLWWLEACEFDLIEESINIECVRAVMAKHHEHGDNIVLGVIYSFYDYLWFRYEDELFFSWEAC